MKLYFIVVVIHVFLFCVLQSVYSACVNPKIRREWSELSESEKQDYMNAVIQLKKRPTTIPIPYNDPSKLSYDHFLEIHYNAKSVAHGTPAFWPWHRALMLRFEQALQSINPNLTVVYWDTASVSQAPERAEIFGSKYYGGNGVGPSRCVQNGVFATIPGGWKCGKRVTAMQPACGCLRRDFQNRRGLANVISAWSGTDETYSTLDSGNYDWVEKMYEGGPHARIHNAINGDMAHYHSPNDPIFWLHHANVDRIWAVWQSCSSWTNRYTKVFGEPDINSFLRPFNLTASNVLNTTGGLNEFCYKYSQPPNDKRKVSFSNCPNKQNLVQKRQNTNTSEANERLEERSGGQSFDILNVPLVENVIPGTNVSIKIPKFENKNDLFTKISVSLWNVNSTYVYEKPEGVLLLDGTDRTDLINLRHPSSVPDQWLVMNGLQVYQIRNAEVKTWYLVDYINSVRNYIPSDALINAPWLSKG